MDVFLDINISMWRYDGHLTCNREMIASYSYCGHWQRQNPKNCYINFLRNIITHYKEWITVITMFRCFGCPLENLYFFCFHMCWDIRQYHICCSTWINIIYGIINMFLNQLFNLLLFVILNFNSIITIIYLRKTLSTETQNQFYLLSL